MLDTMTLTKTMGALCGSLLIFLLGKWAADELYSTSGHGSAEQAYVIETGAEEVAVVEDEVNFEDLLASADLGRGARQFNKCAACHKLDDGANGTGPHLFGIVGRAVGAADGFRYSGALDAVGDTWTAETLSAFIENPRGFAPGTSMAFAGLRNPQERADLIAYLDSIDN